MISIVIPLYNKGKYISATLQSVFNQTYTDYECLIIDDGSTDGSADIVGQYASDPRLKYFRQPNGGVSAARNKGINLAKGDYIAFLDADDKWADSYLAEMVGLTRQYPNESFFCMPHTRIETISEDVSIVSDYCKCVRENVFNTSGVVVKTEVFNYIPPFRVGVNLGEDLDMWLRLSCKHPMVFLNKALVEYSKHTGSSLADDVDVSKSFPYWEWYDYDYPNKKSLYRYATYRLVECCGHLVYAKRYNEASRFLRKCRGFALLKNRIALAYAIISRR